MENRFDIYELPEGHEARFAQKLDKMFRYRRIRISLTWAAAAAALALLVWTGTSRDLSFKMAGTPEKVYTAYLEQVGRLHIMMAGNAVNDSCGLESALDLITSENIPLDDLLPEELSRREKTRILKQYYGRILSDAKELTKQSNNIY